MASAGLDGKICIWAVRPAPVKQCYIAISVIKNLSFSGDDEMITPVRSLIFNSGENLKGISRGLTLKHSRIQAEAYRDFKTNQVLGLLDSKIRIDKKGNFRGLTQIKERRLELLRKHLKTNDQGRTKIETRFDEMRIDYVTRMKNMDPEYDEKIDEEKMRVVIYVGDDCGTIKVLDLTYMI